MVKMKPTQEVKVKDLMEKIKSRFNTTVLSEITNGTDLGVITTTQTFQLADRLLYFNLSLKKMNYKFLSLCIHVFFKIFINQK